VTNASAEHFWLNEGFTVFAERRILEALEGPEATALHAALGYRSLETAIEHFRAHPQHTVLRTHLTGIDPDDVFSQVPYEKGYLLLRAMEEAVGREAFDVYLKRYIGTFRFQALTTEDWVAFTERELPGVLARVNAETYLHQPGIPAVAAPLRSSKLEELKRLKGTVPTAEAVKGWTPAEWQLFLEWLPADTSRDSIRSLDERFDFTQSHYSEVLVSWLVAALRANYPPALVRAEAFLGEVGRMKYLKPLYSTLHSSKEYRGKAREIFQKYAERYHPIAKQGIEGILSRA
jgi:aminopeptidase N